MKLAEFQTLMYICQIMHWLVFCQLVRDWDHLKGEKWNLKKMPLSGWCTGKSVGYLTSWPERRGFWNLRQLVIFHSRSGSREMDASAELIFSLLLQCKTSAHRMILLVLKTNIPSSTIPSRNSITDVARCLPSDSSSCQVDSVNYHKLPLDNMRPKHHSHDFSLLIFIGLWSSS